MADTGTIQSVLTLQMAVGYTRATPVVACTQTDNDSIFVALRLMNRQAPYLVPDGYQVNLRAKKPDGTVVFLEIPRQDGVYVLEIGGQLATAAGTVHAALEVVKGDFVLNSAQFQICVRPRVVEDGEIASEDDLRALSGYVADAEAAADRAEAAAMHQPQVGENGNWWTWNPETGEYEDTGIYSGGDAPYIGENKHWFVGNTDTGVLAEGSQGPEGPQGPAGEGVPEGGTDGQLLGRTESGTAWVDPPQSGVQPDWNQNDPQAPDYVKNRPFYTGDPEETELLNGTFPFENLGRTYFTDVPISQPLEAGKTYKVNWDGSEYSVVAKEFEGGIVAGNLAIMSSDLPDTGEPFLIDYLDYCTIGTLETDASHTIQIYGVIAEVVKIPEQYLPQEVGKSTESGGEVFNDYVNNAAIGRYSHAEGSGTVAYGEASHTEGLYTTAGNQYDDFGRCAHAEGYDTRAYADFSHAEGCRTKTHGSSDHAEGEETEASGSGGAHAEGMWSKATGLSAHAEGTSTIASGDQSHAEGQGTRASSDSQHVQGKYNIEDNESKYAHIVGNGESYDARSNAHTLDWEGNAWFAGTVEGTALILPSSTPDSTKRFRITVDDSGTISAEELVE